jgi:carbamoyl-phosphate synthase large subunit
MNAKRRILLTGAGGPSAIAAMRALPAADFDCFLADMDPHAPGLYLVPSAQRVLVPPGAHPAFVPFVREVCARERIALVIPTVDSELLPLARASEVLRAAGTELLLPPAETIDLCGDKHRLLEAAAGIVPVPRSAVLDATVDLDAWPLPALVKPRRASGSRGVRRIDDRAALQASPRDGALLVQEFLPGTEYSVDVVADRDGRVAAAVPRARLRIDSGIALTSRTVHDPEIEGHARRLAEHLRVRYVANVQFRRDAAGQARLLEVNPRVPGTLPITVAAGVNVLHFAVASALGLPLPALASPFRDVAMVRAYQESFFDPGELDEAEARRWRPKA